MQNNKNRKKTTSVSIFTIILVLITFIYSTFTEEINTSFGLPNNQTTTTTEANSSLSNNISNVEVSFLDVGQGDSILIRSGAKVMLVDTGNDILSNNIKHNVTKYLKYYLLMRVLTPINVLDMDESDINTIVFLVIIFSEINSISELIELIKESDLL